MSDLPHPAPAAIRDWVGSQSYSRGEGYYRQEAIFDTRRQGNVIKARCHGSSGGPYRVEATFSDRRLAFTDCTCPVGPRCKHVAALLLTWHHDPEKFREVEEIDVALGRRSKEELSALVKKMLQRRPELESLLEAPRARKKKSSKPASPEVYKRQAAQAFHQADSDDWDEWHDEEDSPVVGDELTTTRKLGDDFLKKKDPAGAANVYEGVAQAILENFDTVEDDSILLDELGECVAGLGKCLAGFKDANRRKAILKTLYDLSNSEMGEFELDKKENPWEVLIGHATPEERRMIALWARKDLKNPERDKETLGALLLDLEGDNMGDEAYLQVCRETGLTYALVERLLQRGRIEEALRVIEGVQEGYQVLDLANLLVRQRKGDEAEKVVRARLKGDWGDLAYLGWLKTRAQKRRDTSTALDLAERIFRLQPSVENYQELKKLAGPEKWQELRRQLLDFLRAGNKNLLLDIHLTEGEIDEALRMVRERPPQPRYGYSLGGSWLDELKVARAAERTRPREALEIYRKKSEEIIERRGRENYRQACEYLGKVRKLYQELNDEAGWKKYIEDLREKHQSLTALQDELRKARL
jgi:uncharacterized Zn finger protein